MQEPERHITGPSPLSACSNLPDVPPPVIHRENVLDTIDALLDSDKRAVVIEGPDGQGKTTILLQYAERHAERTVALFLSGESRWSYDHGSVRFELCNQLSRRLRGRELGSVDDASDTLLGTLLHEARRYHRRKGRALIFVVDGIQEIPVADIGSRRMILGLLPLGESAFRFVFSGDLTSPFPAEQLKLTPRGYPLTVFSLDETIRFLADLELTRQAIEEFRKVSRGSPGVLSAIRRLLVAGEDRESLLLDLSARLPDPFELEWKVVAKDDERRVGSRNSGARIPESLAT